MIMCLHAHLTHLSLLFCLLCARATLIMTVCISFSFSLHLSCWALIFVMHDECLLLLLFSILLYCKVIKSLLILYQYVCLSLSSPAGCSLLSSDCFWMLSGWCDCSQWTSWSGLLPNIILFLHQVHKRVFTLLHQNVFSDFGRKLYTYFNGNAITTERLLT